MHLITVTALLAVLATSSGVPTTSVTSPRIAGGNEIDIVKAPYQISIELLRWHICGGVIISDKWVLTGAQCVVSRVWAKRIRAGFTTKIPVVGWGGITYGIAQTITHPSFNIRLIDYDVAVVRVTYNIDWSERIQPVALPAIGETEDSDLSYSTSATIAGWGIKQDGGLVESWHLKSVNISLVQRLSCAERYRQQGVQIDVTARVICGGGDGNGGPCSGDIGGGLVQNDKLIGIFSWNKGKCNDPKLPAGFTNLYNEEIRSFIKTRTNM